MKKNCILEILLPRKAFALCFTALLAVSEFTGCAAASKLFDDSTLFRLDWSPDSGLPDELFQKYKQNLLDPKEAVVVSSLYSEKYLCSLPKATSADSGPDSVEKYSGPRPKELLQKLYAQKSCTYRIELYWTYELCHGRFLRQYHEEKEPNRRVNLQEYYLGQYIADEITQQEDSFDHTNPPKRKIDDQMLPYYPVRYLRGTVCDITNSPRVTTVHYVCVPEAKNQIFSLDEVSSCEYEVVILTPNLCSHPAFRAKENPEHLVECFPLEKSPPRPTALTIWEREQNYMYGSQIFSIGGKKFDPNKMPAPSPSLKQPHDESPQRKVEPPPIVTSPVPSDASIFDEFIAGTYCLYGGSGWWKHEYCHGKQVIQFHEDPHLGTRTEVLLGIWNQGEHLRFVDERPEKKPVILDGKVRQVTFYYGHGDVCELTGQERWVEVRLRCREAPQSPTAVTLYLLEPKPCQYILGVESQMFCQLLQDTDPKTGLFIGR